MESVERRVREDDSLNSSAKAIQHLDWRISLKKLRRLSESMHRCAEMVDLYKLGKETLHLALRS